MASHPEDPEMAALDPQVRVFIERTEYRMEFRADALRRFGPHLGRLVSFFFNYMDNEGIALTGSGALEQSETDPNGY